MVALAGLAVTVILIGGAMFIVTVAESEQAPDIPFTVYVVIVVGLAVTVALLTDMDVVLPFDAVQVYDCAPDAIKVSNEPEHDIELVANAVTVKLFTILTDVVAVPTQPLASVADTLYTEFTLGLTIV